MIFNFSYFLNHENSAQYATNIVENYDDVSVKAENIVEACWFRETTEATNEVSCNVHQI